MKAKKLTIETINYHAMPERKHPDFEVGDTISVNLRIKEGDKERLQAFEGDIIKMRRHGIASTITVRKIGANLVPIEIILPLSSPKIDSIELIRKGDVRRAKLYYMRKRVGKAARVKEKVLSREEKEHRASKHAER